MTADQRRRLAKLWEAILPPSYKFEKAFRRTVADLDHLRRLHPQVRFPNDSATDFLLLIGNDLAMFRLQLDDSESLIRQAHRQSVAATARVNGSAAKKVRGANGRYEPAELPDV